MSKVTPGWRTIECHGEPHCRHENGFAAFQGKFYLFGGRRIQAVDVFEPITSSWTSASAPPLEIHHFQPVVIGEEIWFGDCDEELAALAQAENRRVLLGRYHRRRIAAVPDLLRLRYRANG